MQPRSATMPWTMLCLVFMLVLAFVESADARGRTRRRRADVPAILRPLLLARSAVHAIADPIVFNAPRAAAAVAAAPIRIAYQTARHPKIYDAPAVEDEPLDDAEPEVLAHNTRQPARATPAEDFDEEDEPDAPRRLDADEPEFTGGSKPTVSGSRAVVRNGVAYAPSNAPARVKNAIWAANSLRRKPYMWGGGHASFNDRGYDCSGTVSFALHHAGALSSPLPSSEFMRFGERGRGRWITIYSRRGHTFAVIAGLRLDTTDFENGGNTGPRWHPDGRDTSGYVARHPVGL